MIISVMLINLDIKLVSWGAPRRGPVTTWGVAGIGSEKRASFAFSTLRWSIFSWLDPGSSTFRIVLIREFSTQQAEQSYLAKCTSDGFMKEQCHSSVQKPQEPSHHLKKSRILRVTHKPDKMWFPIHSHLISYSLPLVHSHPALLSLLTLISPFGECTNFRIFASLFLLPYKAHSRWEILVESNIKRTKILTRFLQS